MITVAFLGPDGAGKSSVLAGVVARLEADGHDVQLYHLRPHVLGKDSGIQVTEPHARPTKGRVLSLAQAAYWLADMWIWRWGFKRPRNGYSLFDRYTHDLIADPKRVRFGGGALAARITASLAPRPDFLVVLDAPLEVIQARKQEVGPAETERQLEIYRTLAETYSYAHRVDASQPLDAVVESVLRLITP